MAIMVTRTQTCELVSNSHGYIVIEFATPQSGEVPLKRMNEPEPQSYAAKIKADLTRKGQIVYTAASPPLLPGTYAITCPITGSIIKTVVVCAGTTVEVPLNGKGYNWIASTNK